MSAVLIDAAAAAIPLHIVAPNDWPQWTNPGRAWLAAVGFQAEAGRSGVWPDSEGRIAGAIVIAAADASVWSYGGLALDLPACDYACAVAPGADQAYALALGWALGAYRMRPPQDGDRAQARLVWPETADRARINATADGVMLARDLINTPANRLGPIALCDAVKTLADAHGATFSAIEGDALLDRNFPMIHAVGRAAAETPRLAEFTWGPADGYAVTLVGKGVCFDTGGLDLKPAAAMRLMKKDMGGGGERARPRRRHSGFGFTGAAARPHPLR